MNNLRLARAWAAIFLCAAASSAGAQACTEDQAAAKQEELISYLDKRQEKAPMVLEIIEEVETDYGGEPKGDDVCGALEKVLARIREL
ncbi:MAG: hypothetical protein AAF666_10235 [Pseudomonadota bacterium]